MGFVRCSGAHTYVMLKTVARLFPKKIDYIYGKRACISIKQIKGLLVIRTFFIRYNINRITFILINRRVLTAYTVNRTPRNRILNHLKDTTNCDFVSCVPITGIGFGR